jgi:hypothetical protein
LNKIGAISELPAEKGIFADVRLLTGGTPPIGAAIRIAREQKSVSLEKHAEASHTEYRRQKASASGRREFRLLLW